MNRKCLRKHSMMIFICILTYLLTHVKHNAFETFIIEKKCSSLASEYVVTDKCKVKFISYENLIITSVHKMPV